MTTLPEPEPLDAGEVQGTDEEALLDDVATEVDDLEAVVDLTPLDHPRRVLLVHAHPDDEASSTGATIAREAAARTLVAVVTCTRGELGEVVDPSLADLAPQGPDDDRLGVHRVEELAVAQKALGYAEHRWLGGPGRWRDSGMAGEPSNDDPRSFWRADPAATTRALVEVVRELRPQVLVTYDERGGYGHPDHVQAHRVAHAAFDAAGDPGYAPELGEPWQPARLLHAVLPRSVVLAAVEAGAFSEVDAAELPGTPDELVDVVVDARDQLDAKVAALRAYKSQVDFADAFWGQVATRPEFAVEHYVVARGEPARSPGEAPADDLFAGLLPPGRSR